MEYWEHGWNGPGKPRETWAWAVLGSLLVHGLVVAVMLAVLQDNRLHGGWWCRLKSSPWFPSNRAPPGVAAADPAP